MRLSTIHHVSFIPTSLSEPGHGKDVVDGFNAIDKRYIYQLISTVKLTGSKTFDSHILMHSCEPKKDVSLAKEFQKHLSKDDHKHRVIY